MSDTRTYLGQSMSSPIKLINGKAVLVSDKTGIEEAVTTLLNTPIGSRLFLPEYGSRIEELLFEPNDAVVESLARMFIQEAISTWERRIKFKNTEFSRDGDTLNCLITYEILASNEIQSFVYLSLIHI